MTELGAGSTLRAWAQIDLSAIRHNVGVLQTAAGDAAVMAVVKANAYGHGLIPVARAAREAGAAWLGVALLSEALALRGSGDKGRVLTWLPTPGESFRECVAADIDLSASAPWMIPEIAAAARSVGKTARVHLKIDTGLGRSGAARSDWDAFVRLALAAQNVGDIDIVGIWSHLAYADSPDHPTITSQLEIFQAAVRVARELGATPEVCHLANSAATLTRRQTHFDLVRPGISVYGISPGPEVGTSASLGLRPAMTVASRLVQVKQLPAGHGISYAHQYVTDRGSNVGLVPMGYADGLQRRSGNAARVLVGGRQRIIAGRMCMDQFVVDFGDDSAAEGDEVIIFGPGSSGEPTADDWARACDTIAYEVVTCIGPRVPRVYVGGE